MWNCFARIYTSIVHSYTYVKLHLLFSFFVIVPLWAQKIYICHPFGRSGSPAHEDHFLTSVPQHLL